MDTERLIDRHRLLDRFATGQALRGHLMRALVDESRAGAVLQPGSRVGPWTILALLGSGGMSHVYLAERDDGSFNQQVALKMVRQNADLIHRLRHERQLIANLRHPHIVSLIDSGETGDGELWLAMGLVEGLPIDAFARERGLDWAARVRLVDAVCAAVEYAHGRGLIHRDIKPANVLVDAEGHPRLLDFGIAFERGADDPADRVLTPDVAAPEQVSGQPLTTATDVYQLGLLLRRTWAPDGTPVDAPRAVQADLDALVARATAVDPAARHGTAAALRGDLAALLARRPLAHLQGVARVRAARFVERHRLTLAVGTVAFAALAVGLALSALQLRDERDRALASENRAQAIARFLVDTVSTADPWGREAGGGTVVQAMERAAERLDAGLEASPEVRRELRSTIAEVYLQAEEGARCLEVLSTPVAAVDLDGAPPIPRARAQILRSECHLAVDQRDAAWAALDDAERSLGDSDSVEARQLRAWVQVDRGQLRKIDNRIVESDHLLESGLALARESGAREQEYRATRMLGFNRLTAAEWAQAAAQLERAVALATDLYGGVHRSTLTAIGGLAMAMGQSGRDGEAERLLREALDAVMRGPSRGEGAEVVVAELRDNLATLYFQQARWKDCVENATLAFEVFQRLSPETSRAFNPSWRLASCAYSDAQFDLAAEYAAVALGYAHRGAPIGVVNAQRMLAAVAARRGQADVAAEHLQRAEAAFATTQVSNPNVRTALLLTRALVAVARKDGGAARADLDAAAARIMSPSPQAWLTQEHADVSALAAALPRSAVGATDPTATR